MERSFILGQFEEVWEIFEGNWLRLEHRRMLATKLRTWRFSMLCPFVLDSDRNQKQERWETVQQQLEQGQLVVWKLAPLVADSYWLSVLVVEYMSY